MSKLLSFLKVAGCIALLCFVVPIRISGPNEEFIKEFNDYLKTFNKSYPNETEYRFRFKAFKVRKRSIIQTFSLN